VAAVLLILAVAAHLLPSVAMVAMYLFLAAPLISACVVAVLLIRGVVVAPVVPVVAHLLLSVPAIVVPLSVPAIVVPSILVMPAVVVGMKPARDVVRGDV
jgi:hypothetical protein